MPIAGFYRADLYSKLLLPPTFYSASRGQKNTLGVSDPEVQFQLQLLSSPWLQRSHVIPAPRVALLLVTTLSHICFSSRADLIQLICLEVNYSLFFPSSFTVLLRCWTHTTTSAREVVWVDGEGWGKRGGWKRFIRWSGPAALAVKRH